jgi:hypothetical protein
MVIASGLHTTSVDHRVNSGWAACVYECNIDMVSVQSVKFGASVYTRFTESVNCIS